MTTSTGFTDIDLIQGFNAACDAVAVAQRRLFSAIAECDRRELWKADGCRDMVQWLSGRVGISNWAAARWVHAAHALEYLPGTAAAFERGTLSLDKVVELARFATRRDRREEAVRVRHGHFPTVLPEERLGVTPSRHNETYE